MDSLQTFLLVLLFLEVSYLLYASKKSSVRAGKTSIVCDTSALIDGRIVSIAQSGFISSELIVLKNVLRELQYMADGTDHDKRERARYGLDVVKQLQSIDHINVSVVDDGNLSEGGVDERLIEYAKRTGAKICTTDYNLNKVARAENLGVVNVNELAHAIRSIHLPGERLDVLIVSKGQSKEQGVGYLDDGTMVVVDGAKKYMQQTVAIEVTRMLQTEAGRMVFAKLVGAAAKADHVTDKPVSSKARKPFNKQRTKTPQVANRKRKKTPEDTLVDLANQ